MNELKKEYENSKVRAKEWSQVKLMSAPTPNLRSVYSIKHDFEHDCKAYLREEDFADALRGAGFQVDGDDAFVEFRS